MHGFQPHAPDASVRGRAEQLRGAKVANTGFCAACDAYIFSVLRDTYGYQLADAVLDAAAVRPGALELLATETQRAAEQGHPLAPPLPRGLAATDVPLAVAQQGAGCLQTPADAWAELFDEASRRLFYYNAATGVSQWVRPAVVHVLCSATWETRTAGAGARKAHASLAL